MSNLNLCSPPQKKARVILIGTGTMGQVRAKDLYANPRVDLCAICDIDLARARDLAELYSCLSFSTLEEALTFFQQNPSSRESNRHLNNASSDNSVPSVISMESSSHSSSQTTSSSGSMIDGVVLSVPTPLHSQYIELAVQSKLKVVFVEKPVAESAQEVRRLTSLCTRQGVQLCCGFQRRFDDTYVAAAEKVRSGALGKPQSASLHFMDHPCPPKEFLETGGNIFSDLAIHDVNYIQFALGDTVKSVYAVATNSSSQLEAIGIQDTATMVLRFAKGTIVTITLSRHSCYGYDQRCEIFCDNGKVTVGNEHKTSLCCYDTSGVQLSSLKHSYPQRYEHAYVSEIDGFADVLLSDKTWPVTYDNLIEDLRVVEAAKESAVTERIVYLS